MGTKWMRYLQRNEISYVLRVRESITYISNTKGQIKKAKALFRDLKPGRVRTLRGKRRFAKTHRLHSCISGIKTSQGEYVIVIHTEDIKDPLGAYRQRWQIEVMFRAMKSGGLDMEATHITDPDRIETLAAVVTIAFCIAYKAGIQWIEDKPPKTLKHGRKERTIVKIGLDNFQYLLANISKHYKILKKLLQYIFNHNNTLQTSPP